MKKLVVTVWCMLMWSGQAFAATQTCLTTIAPNTPTADFVDNGDGTVTSKKTKLTWKRCSEGQTWGSSACTGSATTFNWELALTQGANASFAGNTDWRVPNLKELASIVERQCTGPSINATIFPATPGISGSYWWSASPFGIAGQAWVVGFGGGYANPYDKAGSHYVRLVRGGQ